MQFPERFSDLPEYAFPRLRRLLDGTPPGGPVRAMSIGEPKHPLPALVATTIAAHASEFALYPPNEGTPTGSLVICRATARPRAASFSGSRWATVRRPRSRSGATQGSASSPAATFRARYPMERIPGAPSFASRSSRRTTTWQAGSR